MAKHREMLENKRKININQNKIITTSYKKIKIKIEFNFQDQ